MRIPKFKFVILLLLLIAIIVPALTFAQEEVDEEDTLNEEKPCNSLVLGLLVQIGRPNECEYFLSLGVGPGQFKHAVNYSSDEVSISTILDDWRGGDDPIGWGPIKQAYAISESDNGFEGTYEQILQSLSELGWGEFKKLNGYTGPPPWAKGGGKADNFVPNGDEESNFDGSNGGPPYGKAKGHAKNKNKG